MVLTIPLGWEFEETKNAAWKLVFPGNGDSAPWFFFHFNFLFSLFNFF